MASNTAKGTKTVKIGGKEVGMKNSSTHSKSNGDEPATRSFGANVGSHKIQGAMKFTAWSSDVKLEGANAIRMGDLTSHNHSNPPGVSAVTASIAGVAVTPPGNCEELSKQNKEARTKMTSQRKKGTKGIRRTGTGPTTITHATYTPVGGSAISMRACSRALVAKFDGGFVQGKNLGQGGGTTTVCGKPFKYAKGGIPKSCHTEDQASAAREEKQAKCFNDPQKDTTAKEKKDRATHEQAIKDTKQSIANTKARARINCAPGNPMAGL